MAVITLQTNSGKTLTMNSALSPSSPYLPINHSGTVYKASLNINNTGPFAVNIGGKTYRTYSGSVSTDQVQLSEDNSLYKYNVDRSMLYDYTADSLISPSSTTTHNVSGGHTVYVLPATPWMPSSLSSANKTKLATWVRNHLTDFENAGLVAYSGPISDMPRNYERDDITVSGTVSLVVNSSGNDPVWTSYSTTLPSKYRFLVDYAFYFGGSLGTQDSSAQLGAPNSFTYLSFGSINWYMFLDQNGFPLTSSGLSDVTLTVAKLINFKGV